MFKITVLYIVQDTEPYGASLSTLNLIKSESDYVYPIVLIRSRGGLSDLFT